MSYTLCPYLIDLEKLRQAVGSRDESLIAAALKEDRNKADDISKYKDTWEDTDDENEEDGDDGEISLDEALRQLVMGDRLNESFGSQYGYALERLCRHLGEEIVPDEWCGVRWAAIEDGGLDEVLTKTGAPVAIPHAADFPTIGHLTAAQVEAQIAELGADHLKHDNEELQELLDEYEGWLRKAAAKKKAIVLFYY